MNTYRREGSQRRSHRSLEAEECGGLCYEKEQNVLDMQLGKGIEGVLEQTTGYVGGVVEPGFVPQVLELSPSLLFICYLGDKYKMC